MVSPSGDARQLAVLAKQYRLQTAYTDGRGQRRRASQESVLATLRALGAPVLAPHDAADAARAKTATVWAQLTDPVVVAWQGRATLKLRIPTTSGARVRCQLRLEDGTHQRWTVDPAGRRQTTPVEVDGTRYLEMRHPLPRRLPLGYHRLTVEHGSRSTTSLVISAPRRAYAGGASTWGCFVPLYALHSRESWGIGDVSDLESVIGWVAAKGGDVVSTLPLLAGFLGEAPFEPSPYLPVSRLFWNEVFVDPRRVPEFADCVAAQRLVASSVFQKEITRLKSATLVDYRRVAAAKRQVLELLAQSLARRRGRRDAQFRQWKKNHPLATQYATFRATGERLGQPRSMWPGNLTPDTLRETRADRPSVRYHLYAQWVAETQIGRVATYAHSTGRGLYLDLPLGVHREGFDVWRYPTLFATSASAGAPPDDLFVEGQNWTAPPPHPETARTDGYQYLRAALSGQLEKSGTLRIDHVMALHRLYWIPNGCDATDGVYVHYPADEMYAILCLESQRHRTRIIGENLGTVPRYVNRKMTGHGIGKLYVAQFQINERSTRPLRRVPDGALACLNTHDTPTLKGFLDGSDIDERAGRGALDSDEAVQARRERKRAVGALRRLPDDESGGPDTAEALSLLRRSLALLARSRADLMVITLEDLWLETKPQNVPGTSRENPNWRRKARYGLEELDAVPQLNDILALVARARASRSRLTRRQR